VINNLAVVEDDPDVRLLIRLSLRSDPRLEVTGEAETAEEAVTMVQRDAPALIILDHYILGAVAGLDAVPDLKAAAPTAKILLFSSHDLSAEVARQDLVDGFLPKTRMADLLRTVQAMLDLQP
jgi:DNA-binding NarL/FixJ family response regulator